MLVKNNNRPAICKTKRYGCRSSSAFLMVHQTRQKTISQDNGFCTEVGRLQRFECSSKHSFKRSSRCRAAEASLHAAIDSEQYTATAMATHGHGNTWPRQHTATATAMATHIHEYVRISPAAPCCAPLLGMVGLWHHFPLALPVGGGAWISSADAGISTGVV